MNPLVLTLILHVGQIAGDVKDIENLVLDLVHKKGAAATKEDAIKFLGDVGQLFTSGLAPLPKGLDASQVQASLQALVAAF